MREEKNNGRINPGIERERETTDDPILVLKAKNLNQLDPLTLPSSRSQAMATWPSSSDPSNQQPDALRKRNKSDQIKFLIPLIYAPVLPLIRLTLRKQPVLRDRLFISVLAGAFAHGTYLVTDLFN